MNKNSFFCFERDGSSLSILYNLTYFEAWGVEHSDIVTVRINLQDPNITCMTEERE